jgi:hypothetical protein
MIVFAPVGCGKNTVCHCIDAMAYYCKVTKKLLVAIMGSDCISEMKFTYYQEATNEKEHRSSYFGKHGNNR